VSYQVTDPFGTPDRREVAVNRNDEKAGSFVVFFRAIPWIKYRALLDGVRRAQALLERLTLLRERLDQEAPVTLEEIQDHDERLDKHAAAKEGAEAAQYEALQALIAWGITGHDLITDATQKPYAVSTRDEKYLGQAFLVLGLDTLDLYGRLGLLPALATYIVEYHNGTLPKTLEEFYRPRPPMAGA
jgi:hypothetical protein